MGYSADTIRADMITLGPEGAQAVLEGMRQMHLAGHLSWLHEWVMEPTLTPAQALTDYGYTSDEEEDGNVVVYGWGGDKIGSNNDEIEDLLSLHMLGTEKARWMWVGEDGEHWGTVFTPGEPSRDVEVRLDFVED